MHLAACQVYGDVALADAAMPQVLELHSALVARGTSHLALWEDNVMRSSWVASSVLSSNAARAQAAAIELQRHLLTIAPGRRTPFEKSLVVNDTYMANLDDFGRATPPLCVWQKNGAWKPLFVFLALRFLLNPDQVLDCERLHARWN